MAYGGIKNIGVGYNDYQSNINQVRLQSTLQKVSDRYTKVDSVNRINSALKKSSSEFLKNYNSKMSDLLETSNALRETNPSSVVNKLAISSSDTSVASAKVEYKLTTAKDIDIDVSQIAQAQINKGIELDSNEVATSDVQLSIASSKGSASIDVSAARTDGIQKTNRQMLQEAATEINRKGLGVTASVVQKDGKSSLQLKSNGTGTENSFDVDGAFAISNGLAEETQIAKDAHYAISENGGTAREYTSSSNNIKIDYGKVSVELKGIGDATISAGMDTEGIVTAMDKLVTSFNDSMRYLSDNSKRGYGVERQISNMTSNPTSGKSMELIGVTSNKNGSLSLDKDKLRSSLQRDPKLTKDIIAGSYGVAQGTFSDAKSGLNIRSDSLISEDIQNAQIESATNSYNFLNVYSKNGAYNMTNYYALGMMMDYYA